MMNGFIKFTFMCLGQPLVLEFLLIKIQYFLSVMGNFLSFPRSTDSVVRQRSGPQDPDGCGRAGLVLTRQELRVTLSLDVQRHGPRAKELDDSGTPGLCGLWRGSSAV